jgi:predicted HTH transcriptional regulator
MRVFRDLEIVEHLGSGILRIVKAYGRQAFEVRKNFLRVILPYAEPIVEATPQVAPKSSGKILQLLRDNPHMTIPELAIQLGISTRAIEKNIKALQSKGQL